MRVEIVIEHDVHARRTSPFATARQVFVGNVRTKNLPERPIVWMNMDLSTGPMLEAIGELHQTLEARRQPFSPSG